MADLRRIARPGITEWTKYDLDAHHIIVSSQTKQKFFGVPCLPPPAHPTLVDFRNFADRRIMAVQDSKFNFFAKLLETYGYNDGRRIVFTHHPLPLPVCGASSLVEMNVFVMDDNEILMVVQDQSETRSNENMLRSWSHLEPTVIAGAIVAYAANNKVRVDMNLPPLDIITIPAITLKGLTSTFYKISSRPN
ncbi:uncharacterized protein BJ212DRAFT_1478509 [Suillus subaureus]|uniref:Uncharacterized protein n=1 Tax=Suillus subaureus TaxID=48587 RepID=A0A9P7EGW4_9AGAM|nr:uncharacterized protein BJ212DRAFT_1478509 [Suillus subaureus]KAG1820394.1 hypothetical protein BJ212DRAFT_1478509 [Suillus subaureus]